MADPNLEPVPDFNGAGYQNICTLMTQGNLVSVEQAVAQLEAAYNADKALRVAAWNDQVRLDQEAEALRAEQARLEEEQCHDEEERAAEVERRELEKKKPKINDFDEHCMGDSLITPRPSAFALNKLKNYEYVELSYFTPEGCAAAMEEAKATADEAFGITKVDGFMALKPVASFKPSRHVVKDKDLTWRQMTMGKNSLIHHTHKLGWPQKHVDALAHFFFKLEDRPMRLRPNGDLILIAFQAAVRREWHDALDRNEGFNIAHINPETLQHVADEFHDRQRTESLNEVSSSFSYLASSVH
jgi:hypothetical protein